MCFLCTLLALFSSLPRGLSKSLDIVLACYLLLFLHCYVEYHYFPNENKTVSTTLVSVVILGCIGVRKGICK